VEQRAAVGKLTVDFMPRAPNMADSNEPPDPAQPDLYWSGHSGWAMLPGLVVGGAASALVMLAAPPIGDWVELREDWTAFIRFWLVLIGWIVAGVIWAYRSGSYVYRLTPTHLYVDFGMLYRPVPPISLDQVTSVECRAWILRRLFGVGAVIVQAKGRKPLRMRGIYRPARFADAIRAAKKSPRTDGRGL
jgi:Bacterial PH domain